MSNEVQLGGGSYSASELFAAIAQSNDHEVGNTEVLAKLDAITTRLVAIEAKLLTLPSNWSIH
ncbi:hypothetical protein OAK87_01345 [bacterium]|nr:hypothetical protein [bacterium]